MEDAMNGDVNTIEGVQGEVLEQVVEPYKVGGEAPEQEAELPIDDAKKFQSMYDRKTADYDKLNNEVAELRKYQQLGQVLEKRPDVVEAMRSTLSGDKKVVEQPKESEQLSEDSFDPWEAYYKPGSPSYEMRENKEKNTASETVKKEFAVLKKQIALNNLKQDLATKHGFDDPAMADDFIQFATNPRDELPIDMLVDVYRKYKGGEQKVSPNLEAVQRTQRIAPTAGIVQGASPEQPNEMDNVWSGVMGVSNRNKI